MVPSRGGDSENVCSLFGPPRPPVPAKIPAPVVLYEDLLIEREMRESYLTYALSVIHDRALPDVRDGLKPSQRRILVAMNDLNLRSNTKYRKCAKIAGDTSGNYHPHGEAIVYPTLVHMAQRPVLIPLRSQHNLSLQVRRDGGSCTPR